MFHKAARAFSQFFTWAFRCLLKIMQLHLERHSIDIARSAASIPSPNAYLFSSGIHAAFAPNDDDDCNVANMWMIEKPCRFGSSKCARSNSINSVAITYLLPLLLQPTAANDYVIGTLKTGSKQRRQHRQSAVNCNYSTITYSAADISRTPNMLCWICAMSNITLFSS